jgi:hypothetical protein
MASLPDSAPIRVGNPYKTAMAVMLICPRCQGDTELRGTMDSWYLTWCPACERLWRLEIWSLLNAEEPERKLPSFSREKRET